MKDDTPDSMMLVHSHSNRLIGHPSPTDIETAKTSHLPVSLISKEGISEVDPMTGKVIPLHDLSWLTSKDKGKR